MIMASTPEHARPINVLILENELQMGGQEKQLFEFVSRIDRSRFNVSVCCLKQGGYFKSRFEDLGIHFFDQLLTSKYDVFAYRRLVRIIREEHIDLIYTYAHANTLAFASLARTTGVVRAIMVAFHAMGSPSGGKLLHAHQRAFLKKADAMMAVADAHKEYLVQTEGLDGSRIRVVHNGVDVERYRPGPTSPSLTSGLGIREGEVVVTAIASLKPAKCIDNLLRAAGRIGNRAGDVRWVLVGDGPDRVALERLAAEVGIGEHVTFTGIRDDVDDILRASDILVLPSRLGTETFPNVILEAMATGLAVVATDVGSVRELVTNGETGWIVPPMDVGALAEKLEDLIGDREKTRRFGEAGRRIIHDRFTLEATCAKRQDLLAHALDRSHLSQTEPR